MFLLVIEKRCCRCETTKPLLDYTRKASSKDGFHPWCKQCTARIRKTYKKKKYSIAGTAQLKRQTEKRAKQSSYLLTWVNDLKISRGCAICNERTLCVLQFHHLHEKKHQIANATRYGAKGLEKELAKCVLLCANCHCKAHAGLVRLSDDMLCKVHVPSVPKHNLPDADYLPYHRTPEHPKPFAATPLTQTHSTVPRKEQDAGIRQLDKETACATSV
jgi:hypothetical protein